MLKKANTLNVYFKIFINKHIRREGYRFIEGTSYLSVFKGKKNPHF